MTTRLSRRDLFALAAAAGSGLALPSGASAAPIDEYDPANSKLAHRVPSELSDSDLLFCRQIGLRHLRVNFPVEDGHHYDYMAKVRENFKKHNIDIISGVHYSYRTLDVQLGRPGRDKDIEAYQTFLRNCGKLGIPYASYDFHPANTYTTDTVIRQPRHYKAREFSEPVFRQKVEKQFFVREYSAEEIWDNYTYFVKKVLPVAEEANVKLALHPDDPPLSKMNGVAKLFTHYKGYKRAEEIAGDSKNWGLTFCVGTWSEGGDKMGKNVFEMIRDFGGRGKIFEIHFRNVTSPLPVFQETFPDDGYMDLYQVMKALRQVKFSGFMVPDHVPILEGDDSGIRRAGTAYCIAYMRALLRRANEEAG